MLRRIFLVILLSLIGLTAPAQQNNRTPIGVTVHQAKGSATLVFTFYEELLLTEGSTGFSTFSCKDMDPQACLTTPGNAVVKQLATDRKRVYKVAVDLVDPFKRSSSAHTLTVIFNEAPAPATLEKIKQEILDAIGTAAGRPVEVIKTLITGGT